MIKYIAVGDIEVIYFKTKTTSVSCKLLETYHIVVTIERDGAAWCVIVFAKSR